MENYKFDKIYEIFGNDYNIKISPINAREYQNISTYTIKDQFDFFF